MSASILNTVRAAHEANRDVNHILHCAEMLTEALDDLRRTISGPHKPDARTLRVIERSCILSLIPSARALELAAKQAHDALHEDDTPIEREDRPCRYDDVRGEHHEVVL